MKRREWRTPVLLSIMILLTSLVTVGQFLRLGKIMGALLPKTLLPDYPSILPPDIDTGMGNQQNFSACLLVMDDNHLLTEWLAYHYHTLPLRRLIVAVDPRSRTSPTLILNRWKHRIDITEWHDSDYWARWERQSLKKLLPNMTDEQWIVRVHRSRQRRFYFQCLQQLKKEDASWVAMVDTDEFLNWNPHWKFAKQLSSTDVVGLGDSRTVAQLLRKLANYKTLSLPCVGVPRLLFGPYEDKENSTAKRSQENSNFQQRLFFNTSHFVTLRCRWHGKLSEPLNNLAGKSLIDLSRISWSDIHRENTDIHRPIRTQCKSQDVWMKNAESPLVLHHYIGSYKQWVYRDDVRGTRTKGRFEALQDLLTAGRDDESGMQGWLKGFVQNVGLSEAQRLLQGIGILEPRGKEGPEQPATSFWDDLNEPIRDAAAVANVIRLS